MTKQLQDIDRPGQAGVEFGIDISAEMIAAGREALFPNEVLPWYDEDQVVAKIYRAMAMAEAHSSKHVRCALESETCEQPRLAPS